MSDAWDAPSSYDPFKPAAAGQLFLCTVLSDSYQPYPCQSLRIPLLALHYVKKVGVPPNKDTEVFAQDEQGAEENLLPFLAPARF